MARYLNRSYWENRTEQQTAKPTLQYHLYAPTNVRVIKLSIFTHDVSGLNDKCNYSGCKQPDIPYTFFNF